MTNRGVQTVVCFIAVLLMTGTVLGIVRNVPQDHASIQDAILACQNFDTIIVAPGRYTGPGNRNISFKGKAITVRSMDPNDFQIVKDTIIDCEGQSRGFVFNMAEKADSTLSGLTITNGYGILGGAIYCYNNSSPSITNCVINNNSAVIGGGITCTGSNTKPKIVNCNITANSALIGGGGCYFNVSSPIIKNCIVSGNTAPYGGAFYSHYPGNPLISNCTVTQNTASNSAGAVYCYDSSNVTVTHSILWGNTAPYAPQIKVGNSGAATSIQISYSNLQGGRENIVSDDNCTVEWGQGNIDADPNFVGLGSLSDSNIEETIGDYHLLDESPCIDAGDPDFVAEPSETDIDGNARILGMKIDIGADEFVPPFAVVVKITPKVINPRSKGGWIICTIQFPNEYSVGKVNTGTIILEEIQPTSYTIDEKANKLLMKFDRNDAGIQQLLKDLLSEGSIPLTATGALNDGTTFEGSDTIGILQQERGK